MTDTTLSLTALTEAAKEAGVTTDQARTILEAAGVKVEPEKPALPAELGSVIIATEVRGVTGKWVLALDGEGDWLSTEQISVYHWHAPKHITAWTEARVIPVATAPVTLTEDQVGEVWDKGATGADTSLWLEYPVAHREEFTRLANDILAQYVAPAEGEPIAGAVKPIDVADVREGDLVRMVLNNGDEVTITVKSVEPTFIESGYNYFSPNIIRAVHLLHREEA